VRYAAARENSGARLDGRRTSLRAETPFDTDRLNRSRGGLRPTGKRRVKSGPVVRATGRPNSDIKKSNWEHGASNIAPVLRKVVAVRSADRRKRPRLGFCTAWSPSRGRNL